jgi:signal transduction histidine kinase
MMSDQKPTINIVSSDVKKSIDINPWIALVIDDEESVLMMTKEVLKEFSYKGRGLKIITASSYEEGKIIYDEYPGAAFALIDCVMEHNTAGLDLVKYIREENRNILMQLVLRTGQPGFAPERGVLLGYKINDYLSKVELTSAKLYHSVITYLRAFENISLIDSQKGRIQRINHSLNQKNGELTALNDLKDHMTLFISNELKFPLESIKKSTQSLLEDGDDLLAYQTKALRNITNKTSHINQVIMSLLKDTAFEKNQYKLDCVNFNLSSTVRDFMPILATQVAFCSPAGSVAVEDNIVGNDLHVFADPERIKQVISLLVKSTAKRTVEGAIKIECEEKDGFANVSISAGLDMEPEKIQQLQNLFRSSDVGMYSKDDIEIQLFVVKKIIELHCKEVSIVKGDYGEVNFVFNLSLVKF